MVFCYGSYATSEVTLLRSIVRAMRSRNSDPLLFLDIGANAGHHTLFMASIADQVIAFEPYPPLQAQIRDKLEFNKITNVKLMPFGLGEQDQVLNYYPAEGRTLAPAHFFPTRKRGSPSPSNSKSGMAILSWNNRALGKSRF